MQNSVDGSFNPLARMFEIAPFVFPCGPQKLERRPEPSSVTAAPQNVLDYNSVMTTKLVVTYAILIELIHRLAPISMCENALDLACGPGHFSLCLARYLPFKQVNGMDLSAGMVEQARANANEAGLQNICSFQMADMTQLGQKGSQSGKHDLVITTNAVHHLNDLDAVARLITTMATLTKPDGLVVIMDVARLRTVEQTERYVEIIGRGYASRNLTAFLEDFRNSMYAAWTAQELATVIPADSHRRWWHIASAPSQIIVGLPAARSRKFMRSGFSAASNPLVKQWYPEWEKQVGRRWAQETLMDCQALKSLIAIKALF